jgi:predicted nucleotidyltransferase
MKPEYRKILQALTEARVEFVLIGGLAANLRGSARVTLDVDIVYARSRENIRRLVEALRPHSPYLRGAPPGLPFSWDEMTVRMGLNFTLVTALGDVDLLGEVAGGGNYEQLLPYSSELEAFGVRIRCVTLERLIQLKRAAGRPKDWEALAELEALLEERRKRAVDGTAS